MAVLATFTAGFRGFFTVVGEVPARRLAAFFTGFGGFFAIIGKVARVFITCSHDSSPVAKFAFR